MVFEHLVYNLNVINDNVGDALGEQIYILLNDDVDNEEYKAVAQAISLDIRGDFGFFLNRNAYEIEKYDRYRRFDEYIGYGGYEEDEEYEWVGNLFRINVNTRLGIVRIEEILDEEGIVYNVDYKEWEEALLDWKEFYLHELGFLDFDSIALSHMMGVLILTYDQMDGRYLISEMVTEAIKQCAKRYGVKESVIYRDCKKVTGLYSIEDFYSWVIEIFENGHIYKGGYLNEFILSHIKHYGDVESSLVKHFGIYIV